MKNFLYIIAFLIVLTTVIVGSNPQMHKPMNIGGVKLEVQDNSNIKNTDLKVENKDSIIDKTPVAVKPVDIIKPVENITPKEIDFDKKWEQLLKIQEQEDNARIQAEQKHQIQLQKQQEEQTKKLAEQKAQEEAKKKADEKAKKLAEQKKIQEEQAKRLAEQKRLQEEQAKKLAQQKAQEEAKRKAAEEALEKKQAEEQARKLAEQKAAEEARNKAEAEALAKKKAEEQKKLVEYQENILWNQWRANVCNNVAKKLDKQFAYVAPAGTVYTYSFDVDNQRRITNINVKISRGYINSTTQQGVFMIRQAIQSMNLSSFLTYPPGSQRTTVKVSSGIERTSAQSTTINANSFNDVETITKQKYE